MIHTSNRRKKKVEEEEEIARCCCRDTKHTAAKRDGKHTHEQPTGSAAVETEIGQSAAKNRWRHLKSAPKLNEFEMHFKCENKIVIKFNEKNLQIKTQCHLNEIIWPTFWLEVLLHLLVLHHHHHHQHHHH